MTRNGFATLGDLMQGDLYDRLATRIDINRGAKAACEKPPQPRPVVAHITVHGDMFCVSCKRPEAYADGHDWLPVYEGEERADTCDECGVAIGGGLP